MKAKIKKNFINKAMDADDISIFSIFDVMDTLLKPTIGKLGHYSDEDCCYVQAICEIYKSNRHSQIAPLILFNLGYLQAIADREELVEFIAPTGFKREIKVKIKEIFTELMIR